MRTPRKTNWHPKCPAGSATDMARIFRSRAKWRWLAMLFITCMVGPAQAQDPDVTPGQMQSGSLLLKMKSGYAIATRMNTNIEARVSGLVARVSVRQEFRNDGQEWVEGIYVFPLPDAAAVDRLRMHIGERFIEGEIREKEKAKKEYEAAKSAGKKASLVEQQRANLFTTSVANIAPHETVIIEIEYLETLKFDEGTLSLRFPLTMTPRYIPGAPIPGRKGSGWAADTSAVPDASLITPPVVTRSKDHRVTFQAVVNAGTPLEFIASRYHPIDVENKDDRYMIELSDSNVPMDHDLELTWKPVADKAPRAMMFTESVNGQQHILLMMLPPDDLSAPAPAMPRELIFVIDTSGSMHGTSIEQARRALMLALDGLRPVDRFNVIQFNSVTSALFPGTVEASTTNIRIAGKYVSGLAANGGTEMRPAIERAMATLPSETHLRQVIFITDGSVGNEEGLFRLIEKRLGNARLFTVGIGSAPNSWFMRKAAEAGRGTFTIISALHEVNEKMGRLFRKLEQPQITDIVVEWPSGNDAEDYPGTIPDLYAGEPIYIRARLASPTRTGDLVKVRGNSATGSWGAELEMNPGDTSAGIAALWARGKIEDLMDRQRRGADADATRKAVIETALKHHLVSKYTSLVAVDKTPVRPQTASLSKEQVPSLLPYGQNQQAIFGFPETATSAPMLRMSGLFLIATALGLLLMLTVPGRRTRHDSSLPV